jgi:4-amino-4-deoxy-L-arabinose transferase-like glycosyltransferase
MNGGSLKGGSLKADSTAVWLLLFYLGLYLLTSGIGFYSSDGEVMYRTTMVLVEDHTLAIPCDRSLPQGLRGPDGRCYSTYGPGQAVAAIPLYMTGKALRPLFPNVSPWDITRLFVARLNQMVTALACVLVAAVGQRLYGSWRAGAALALVYGLSTLAWPYSRFYFSEPLVALCLLASLYGLLRYRDGGSNAWVALASAAWGFAFLTRITTLMVLPLLAGYAAFTVRRQRGGWSETISDLARLAVPVVLAGIIYMGHNVARFGHPLNFGYPGESWTTPPWIGLYGLLFSTGKSLFLFAPVLLLSPWALAKLYRRGWRLEAVLFSGISLAYLAFHMGWWTWHGGWSWGPRFLVPIVPFLVLPLGSLWRETAHRAVTAILAAVSLIPQVLGVSVDFNRYMLEINDEAKILFSPAHSPILGHLNRLLEGKVSFGLLQLETFGLPPAAMPLGISVCLGMLIAGTVGLWRNVGSDRSSPRSADHCPR